MEPWLWSILLLGLAILLAILELFVPSGGLLGFLAFLSLIGSGTFAFLIDPLFGIVYVAGLSILVPMLLWKFLQIWPHTSIGRRLLLDPGEDPALVPDENREKLKLLVGHAGVAKSRMMPSGTVEVDGRRLDALSEGMPIDPGKAVVVVRVDGINIIVREGASRIVDTVPSLPSRRVAAEEPTEEPTVDDPFS